MTTNNVYKSFTVLVIFASLLSGCAKSAENAKNPLSSPTLNETKSVTLAKRTRASEDNYTSTCLFLNESFRTLNNASVCAQVDLSLTGAQVTDQKAEFVKLQSASTVSTFSLENSEVIGETVKSKDFKVGEIYLLKKSDRDVSYQLVIEITKIEENSITLDYQVKTFSLVW